MRKVNTLQIWSESQQRWADVHGITLTGYRYAAAKAELRDRLNARLHGEDPGEPINWPGLKGTR